MHPLDFKVIHEIHVLALNTLGLALDDKNAYKSCRKICSIFISFEAGISNMKRFCNSSRIHRSVSNATSVDVACKSCAKVCVSLCSSVRQNDRWLISDKDTA